MNNFHRIWFQNFRQFSNLFSQIWLKKRHTSLFAGICREIRTKFHKKFVEKCNFDAENEKNRKFIIHSRKNVDDFWLKFWDLSGAKVCKSCRSRQELSSEYLLAKIGVDTAENEPLEVWEKIFNIIHWCPYARLVRSVQELSLIHIWRCRRSYACRSRWSPYH